MQIFNRTNHKRIVVNSLRLGLGLLASLAVLSFAPAIVSAATLDDLEFTLINSDAEYSVSAKDASTIAGAVDIPATHNGKPVTEIGSYGFGVRFGSSDFPDITSVTIPNSIQVIGNFAFTQCTALTAVTFAENSQVTSIGNDAFAYCQKLTNIDLPASLTTLGNRVFEACSELISISIPSQITVIPTQAFHHCNKLSRVTLHDAIVELGDYAFASCDALSILDLPDSLVSIGGFAFSDTGLTEITLPASVTSIEYEAFYNSRNLASINFLGSAPTLGNGAFSDTGISVGGFTITIYDTHEASYASWPDSYTFNVVPEPDPDSILLYTAVSYNPTTKAFSIITENEDSETSLNLQHKASLSADWATLSNLAYITSTEANTQRTTRTLTLDPEANPSGFYRLISTESSP